MGLREGDVCVCTYEFEPQEEDELHVLPGDELVLVEVVDDEWVVARKVADGSACGLVATDFIKPKAPAAPPPTHEEPLPVEPAVVAPEESAPAAVVVEAPALLAEGRFDETRYEELTENFTERTLNVAEAAEWTPDLVARWMSESGLGDFSRVFLERAVDGRSLLYSVDADFLEDCGIAAAHDVARILGAVSVVRRQVNRRSRLNSAGTRPQPASDAAEAIAKVDEPVAEGGAVPALEPVDAAGDEGAQGAEEAAEEESEYSDSDSEDDDGAAPEGDGAAGESRVEEEGEDGRVGGAEEAAEAEKAVDADAAVQSDAEPVESLAQSLAEPPAESNGKGEEPAVEAPEGSEENESSPEKAASGAAAAPEDGAVVAARARKPSEAASPVPAERRASDALPPAPTGRKASDPLPPPPDEPPHVEEKKAPKGLAMAFAVKPPPPPSTAPPAAAEQKETPAQPPLRTLSTSSEGKIAPPPAQEQPPAEPKVQAQPQQQPTAAPAPTPVQTQAPAPAPAPSQAPASQQTASASAPAAAKAGAAPGKNSFGPVRSSIPQQQLDKARAQNLKMPRNVIKGLNMNLSPADLNRPVITGWLWKQGGSGLGKNWKQRWFVLQDFCLYYFKSQTETMALGMITMPSYRISRCAESDGIKKPFAFRATHDCMKPYYFHADDHQTMVRWMENLALASVLELPAGYKGADASKQKGQQPSAKSEPAQPQQQAQQQQQPQPQAKPAAAAAPPAAKAVEAPRVAQSATQAQPQQQPQAPAESASPQVSRGPSLAQLAFAAKPPPAYPAAQAAQSSAAQPIVAPGGPPPAKPPRASGEHRPPSNIRSETVASPDPEQSPAAERRVSVPKEEPAEERPQPKPAIAFSAVEAQQRAAAAAIAAKRRAQQKQAESSQSGDPAPSEPAAAAPTEEAGEGLVAPRRPQRAAAPFAGVDMSSQLKGLKSKAPAPTFDVEATKQTFLQWLRKNHPAADAGLSLEDTVKDGVALIGSLEAVSQQAAGKYNKAARMPMHCMDNLNVALAFAKKLGIDSAGTTAEDLYNGNSKKYAGFLAAILKVYPFATPS